MKTKVFKINQFIFLFIFVFVLNSFRYKSYYSLNQTKFLNTTIVIQSFENFDEKTISKVKSTLSKYFTNVKINSSEKLPTEAYFAPRKRFRADKIIDILDKRSKKDEIFLGVTHEDISSTKGTIKDYGLMGLALKHGKGAVISDFRLKDKSKIDILAIHEIGHTFGLSHCPQKYCYMQSANGKDHTKQLNQFCISCTRYLKKRGWIFSS